MASSAVLARVLSSHRFLVQSSSSSFLAHKPQFLPSLFSVAHIPGALFFDVYGISYRTTNLPHMLPSEEAFAAAVSALGIENKDGLVVYDGKGFFRVWWMFRVFGHDRVWVLDGVLPRWHASGFDVESSASVVAIFKASAASEAI